MIRAAVTGLALLALAARSGSAQRLTGVLAISLAEHRVDIGAGVEVSRGPLFGAGVRAAVTTRWIASLEAMAGALAADGDGPDRDVGQLCAALGFQTTSWLTLEAVVGARTYSAAIARQRWTSVALGAEARMPFADGRVEGVGRIALLPVVAVTDLEGSTPGVSAAAGVRYRTRRATLGVSYWLERYDFSATTGVVRRERLSGITVGATWSPRSSP